MNLINLFQAIDQGRKTEKEWRETSAKVKLIGSAARFG